MTARQQIRLSKLSSPQWTNLKNELKHNLKIFDVHQRFAFYDDVISALNDYSENSALINAHEVKYKIKPLINAAQKFVADKNADRLNALAEIMGALMSNPETKQLFKTINQIAQIELPASRSRPVKDLDHFVITIASAYSTQFGCAPKASKNSRFYQILNKILKASGRNNTFDEKRLKKLMNTMHFNERTTFRKETRRNAV
jgi:hypothetical protein